MHLHVYPYRSAKGVWEQWHPHSDPQRQLANSALGLWIPFSIKDSAKESMEAEHLGETVDSKAGVETVYSEPGTPCGCQKKRERMFKEQCLTV